MTCTELTTEDRFLVVGCDGLFEGADGDMVLTHALALALTLMRWAVQKAHGDMIITVTLTLHADPFSSSTPECTPMHFHSRM